MSKIFDEVKQDYAEAVEKAEWLMEIDDAVIDEHFCEEHRGCNNEDDW